MTQWGARVAGLAALYIVAAKLGIELHVAHGVVTPVWAPTGISIAAVLIFGYRVWPGIALGAFIANATSDVSLAVAAAIAAGNTAEALVAGYLLRRFDFGDGLGRVRDVIVFVAIAVIAATAVSATNGVTVLAVSGEIDWSGWSDDWLLWWFGDAIGALLVAPVILIWVARVRQNETFERRVEGLALAVLLIAVSSWVFIGGSWKYPYLIFPLLVWASLRFGVVGSATAMLIVGGIGTWGTVEGAIPIGGATATESVQVLQALISVMGVAILVMAATVNERAMAEKAARSAQASMEEAQRLVHLGSWEWDIPNDTIHWSEEMYRIYGYADTGFPVSFERAMERVLEEDRVTIEKSVTDAFELGSSHELPEVDYRIRLEGGTIRTLRGRGYLEVEDGRHTRMLGTVLDVTEAVAAERVLGDAYERERQTSKQLRELDEMKNTFISAVSHDLRTPLSTIVGLSHAIRAQFDRLSQEELMHVLERIESNAERTAHMLNNLLDLDRLSRDAVEITRSEVDLSDVALRVAHSIEVADRDVHVDHHRVIAMVDEGLVERMIENLLQNAIRHTRPDSPIWVRMKEEEDGALIAVEDDGPGVPDDLKEAIFRAFHRGGNQTAVGSGIGLFLVDQFARLHGGKAWVEDRAAGGASFKVKLPRSADRVASNVA